MYWVADRIDHIHELFDVVATREDGLSYFKLCQQTTQTPHIDRKRVGFSEYDLRSSVVTRLEILVHLLALQATGAEIH